MTDLSPNMDRVAELKARVDELKAAVRDAQNELTLIKGSAEPDGGKHYWQRLHAAKKSWNDCVRRLQEAKTDLVRVTGTTGSDPRWSLISDAWRLLQRLEDSGVDIGEDGRKLLDEIEFHIPASKLVAHRAE
jgi:hypothetical protein